MAHIDYMLMALAESLNSCDPSTRVGAVLVTPQGHTVSAHNRFPLSYPDRFHQKTWGNRDGTGVRKYDAVLHAEHLVLRQAAGKAAGGTLYCTHQPCSRCAAEISESGVVRVFYALDIDPRHRPEVALEILRRCGTPTMHLLLPK